MKKVLLAVVLSLATTGAMVVMFTILNHREPPVKPESNSALTQKLNDAFINYVRLGQVARTAADDELLALGYRTCNARKNYPEQTIILNIELEYPYAGRRIYDGATQYLCDTY